MSKKTALFIVLSFISWTIQAQPKKLFNESKTEKEKRMAWWTDDRFGMFIHWGIYSRRPGTNG